MISTCKVCGGVLPAASFEFSTCECFGRTDLIQDGKVVDLLTTEEPRLAKIWAERDARGLETYGASLMVSSCTNAELMAHIRDELADVVVYARALRMKADEDGFCGASRVESEALDLLYLVEKHHKRAKRDGRTS